MAKVKSKKWFIKVRGSYLPNSWQGWLTYIPYSIYMLGVIAYVYNSNYNVWLSAFIVLPNWVVAVIVMTWLADKKS